MLRVALVCAVFAATVAFALHVFYWTPPVQPASRPPALFSEERARQHVAVLTEDIGVRSVGTPGLQAAHAYVWGVVQQLQRAAAARGELLRVEVDFEHYTGAFDFHFVGERFMNAYHNISNIIIHIARKGQEERPAVLLVAHHDSPVGSPGAGDDASNVGVMLELASNLVASEASQLPRSPVMFLFSGAEEPLCQSAAAFMRSSRWAARVGAFINLESIGPGGAPIVFQHAGAWTIEAYARGAVHPRGAVAAQDIFDAGLVLGDTDYRQLSYRDRGGLPGLDVAYLLSGAAYHTDRDTLSGIRPGVLQETGETLTGSVASLAAALAAAGDAGPEALGALLRPTDHRRLFMSVGGRFMLTYSAATAAVLHNVPLALALSAPAALALLAPDTALPLGDGVRVMLGAAARGLVTLLAVLLVPAAAGAARATLTGTAMVWFGRPVIAFTTYFPLAAAVLLAPWCRADYSSAAGGRLLPYHMLGGALLNSALAAALTRAGAGMAMLFALWGGCGVLAALCVSQGVSILSLSAALLAVVWPIYTCAETALVMCIVMMSRMSLTGHVHVALGDAIVGLLLGLGAVSLTGMVLLPMIQALLGKRSKQLAVLLVLVALAVTAATTWQGVAPYTESMPKRLMLAHAHYTAPADAAAAAAAATPHAPEGEGGGEAGEQEPPAPPLAMRVVNSSWVIAGSDSNPAAWVAEALGFNLSDAQAGTGSEFSVIYPVSKLLDMLLFPAPPPPPELAPLPHVRLLSRRRVRHRQRAAGGGGELELRAEDEVVEATLEVFVPQPCWGTLKLSGGGLVSWSTVPGVWHDAAAFVTAQQRGSGSALVTRAGAEGPSAGGNGDGDGWRDNSVRRLVIKFSSEHQQGPLRWPLVVRFREAGDGGGQDARPAADDGDGADGLAVELHVGIVQRTSLLAALIARLPRWATMSFDVTVFISCWLV